MCLLDTIPKTVLAFGAKQGVDILMVGEGPGLVEDLEGFPFIGPAGKLLRQAIEDAQPFCTFCDGSGADNGFPIGTQACQFCKGYGRLTIGLTNLIACRPYQGKPSSSANKPPSVSEVINCFPRLRSMIKVLKPTIVVCVGKEAELYLKDTIVPFDYGVSQEKLYTIIHPSYVLRNGGIGSHTYNLYVPRLQLIYKRFWELRRKEVKW